MIIARRKRAAAGGGAPPGPQQYCVAGAGAAGYNRTYTDSGLTFNSKPYYTYVTDDTYYLYAATVTSAIWCLNMNALMNDTAKVGYKGPATTTTPDDGAWTAANAAAPAPTVTDGACP